MKNYLLIFILLSFLDGTFAQSNSQLYEEYDNAVNKGKHKKAEKILHKLSKLESNNFLFSLRTAQYFANINELDSASFYIEKAIDQYKNLPISHTSKNFVLTRDSLYKSSISIYDSIISKNPADWHYCNRGILKKDIGLYRESLADFTKAIEIDSLDYLNYYNRGLAYRRLNLLDSAISDYSKSNRLNPWYSPAYLNKGYALMLRNDFEKAIEEFNKGLALPNENKEKAFIKNNIGYVYYKLEKYELAEKYIKESLQIYPINSFAYKNLALINIALKNFQGACRNIEEAIELGFVNQFGNEIIQLKRMYCE